MPEALLAQQRIYRIGFVIPPREAGARALVESFRSGMRELGYAEGRNLVLDLHFAEDDLSRLPALATEVVRRKPDVIVTASPPGVRAAKNATTTIPIVIAAVYDPVGQGFVASLARPGGNITGMSVQYEDTIPKLLELLAAMVPGLRKVGVLHTVDSSHASFLARIDGIAAPRRIAIQAAEARSASELDSAFAALARAGAGGLIVLPHPLFNTRPSTLVRLAATHRLPAVYPFRSYAEAGGLLSLGIDLGESFHRAAHFVHRILQGANPADLPVEQPAKMDLVVNVKAAAALGLKVPQSLLVRADRIIDE